MYWKEIIYMSLFENEMKKECVGYLKSEKKQNEYQLEMQVKKIPVAIVGDYPIRLQDETGWQETGMLTIKDGAGKWNGAIKNPVLKVEIMMSNAERIKGESKKAQTKQEQNKQTENRQIESKSIESKPIESKSIESKPIDSKPIGSKPIENKPIESKQIESKQEENKQIEITGEQDGQKQESKPVLYAESMLAPVKTVSIKSKSVSAQKPLYENKWEQLLSTYEQIHPYGDNRVYVKLEPKDFIVLRENYQHLVNNSFLLHGFYNYRYLILGKEREFYLGVPGVFYEREKMVALMFGFEAFECEGGEAEEGKFGYYLRKVEL